MPLLSLHNVFCTALTLYNSGIMALRWIHLYRNTLIKYSSSDCAWRWLSRAGDWRETHRGNERQERNRNILFALWCERLHLWYFEGEITTFWQRCKKQPRGVRQTKIPAGAKQRGKTDTGQGLNITGQFSLSQGTKLTAGGARCEGANQQGPQRGDKSS